MNMATQDLLQQTIERFWDTVPAVWGKVRCNVRSNATKDYSINLVQFHILRHIRHGVNTAGELAEKIMITRPAVSQAVDLLVEKGLVNREENPNDRRFVSLELTGEGETLLNSVFAKSRKWMGEQMDSLTDEEMDTIIRALGLLKQTFKIS
jgi:DNA-binding MarR family transcriptional regulator